MIAEGARDADDDHEDAANQSFINLAGEDGEVDAFELKNILDSVFKRGISQRPAPAAALTFVHTGSGVRIALNCGDARRCDAPRRTGSRVKVP